jgi:hypothetical protein
MALQAKFLSIGKGGTLAIYEVRGTSTELATYVASYKDREPVFKSTKDGKLILDAKGQKTPLLFTAYPMPGKNVWHPLYEKADGTFTLDKQDLNFEILVSKSMGADFGQAYASEAARRYADSTSVSSTASSILSDDEEDEADEEDFTASASEDAELDVVAEAEAPTPTAKKTTK